MNKIIKKIINSLISTIFIILKNKHKRTKVLSFFSRLTFDRNNLIEFDSSNNLYWLKTGKQYLYAVEIPQFNFSKEKLFQSIESIYCKKYIPKSADVVVDIGAGIGTELVYFTEKVGINGKVYSVEASKSSFIKTQLLCLKNEFINTINFNLAICDFNGEIWIEETLDFEKNRINNEKQGNSVDAITFDEFVDVNKIEKIDFLKINIEGGELEMFQSMTKSLNITENIAVSCHDFLFQDSRRIKQTIVSILELNGFQIFYNSTGNIVTDSWIYAQKK